VLSSAYRKLPAGTSVIEPLLNSAMKKSKWFAHIDHSPLMVLREREFSLSIVLTVTKPEFIASIEIKENNTGQSLQGTLIGGKDEGVP
jgi:hypothetical protein